MNIIYNNTAKTIKKILFVVMIAVLTALLIIYSKKVLKEKASLFLKDGSTYSSNVPSIELEEAYVYKIVDGDTLWVKINDKETKVRFIGINSPEYTKKIEHYGKEATEYTASKLLDKTVYLQKDVSDTDEYDRLLRYVWTEKIDEITEENISKYLFNYELVHEGMAKSKKYEPDTSLQQYLTRAEQYAIKNKKGMWK